MPTISVPRELFYQELGVTMTDEKFDELCFEFGIELDEVTSEKKQAVKETGDQASHASLSEEVIYKIEIPANRYDLLCMEGLVDALRVFLGLAPMPNFEMLPGSLTMKVAPETAKVRPYVVCGVLRDITFTQASYDSFIELQDKLHTGLARHRTLISMGTHDLDTVEGPFSYEARSPEQIKFKPLNQTAVVDGHGLMALYEQDNKIKKYLHIIRDSPVYPVIYDAQGRVLSLPPLINSDHSKISLNTKNVFIEVTATDLNKAKIGLNMIIAAFSRYCKKPYTAETVKIEYPNGEVMVTPDFTSRVETVSVAYINRMTGLNLTPERICELLSKMMLEATPNKELPTEYIDVNVSAVRSDVLHACDIMEDVAIAYGFDNLPRSVPSTFAFGSPLPINKLSDFVRKEIALAGFSEVLTFTLCSKAENFDYLLKPDNGEAVVVSNPKTIDFEVIHTSLIPQILKTISSNKSQSLPIKIFQVLDVVLQSPSNDVGARNERRLCAAFCAMTPGFQVIHGLLDRVMQMLDVPHQPVDSVGHGYYIKESSNPTFFQSQQAQIYYKGQPIGHFGVVSPKVTQAFEAPYVTTLLELNLEPFL